VSKSSSEPAEQPSALPVDTRMSLIRTRLSFERTLMSWVRTAVTLITFGFTLFRAFSYLEQHGAAQAMVSGSGHGFATAMIGIGLTAVVVSVVQHWRHVAVLRELDAELPLVSVGFVVAVTFVAVGAWALFDALARR
jgi:putative membrane protein